MTPARKKTNDASTGTLDEAVPIADLWEDPANARTHDERNLASITASLRSFGQVDPLIVLRDTKDKKRNGKVLAGNGRLVAMRDLGWEHVRVLWMEWTDSQATAFGIAHNRTGELASWDNDVLGKLLKQISEEDHELFAVSGFTADEMRALLEPPRSSDEATLGGDGEAGEAPAKPVITQAGDLWFLGEHRLLCADSTDSTAFEHLLGEDHGNVNCVWTDPPYGVGYVGKTSDAMEIENDEIDADALHRLLDKSLRYAADACKAGAPWYVAAPPGPLFHVFGTTLTALGIWRQTLVWVKNSMVMGWSDFHYQHEPIFYGWKPGAAHVAPPERTHTSVLEFDRPKRNGVHPTMKPIPLVEYCLRVSSEKGDLVMDPFGGSGSTLIACENLGRRGAAIELSPAYCDVIVHRWQAATGGDATLSGDGATFAAVSKKRKEA